MCTPHCVRGPFMRSKKTPIMSSLAMWAWTFSAEWRKMWNIYIQQAILSIHYYQNKNTVGILATPSKKASSACYIILLLLHQWKGLIVFKVRAWYSSSALPVVSTLPQADMDEKLVGEMRNYACNYTASMRQRTTRQGTTMAKHGTMPEIIYQRKLVITEKTNFANR